MDFFIGLTSLIYLSGAVLGYLKGKGRMLFTDQFRHQLIHAAFIWHTLMILWPVWQFGNYPFVTTPYERIVVAWAVIAVYLLWTRKYNLLIVEMYVLFSAFFLLLSVNLTPKIAPEIISVLWLGGGGIIKHLLFVGTFGFMLNTIVLEHSLDSDNRDDKQFLKYYGRVLILWVLTLGTNYYWQSYLQIKSGSEIGSFNLLWVIALTIFMLINLYVRKMKSTERVNKDMLHKMVISFLVITLFAVAFGI